MGRKKQGFNWKARQNVKTVIDKSEQSKIKVDLHDSGSYDECNSLVLPSKKRKTKVKKESQQVQRLLSKSQRKKLEKIVAKKKKKENRAELLEKLSQVQVSDSEINRMTTLATIQTKGLKKRWDDEKVFEAVIAMPEGKTLPVVNAIKGSKRKLRLLALTNDLPAKQKKIDPNIIGFEESSDESGSEDESTPMDASKEDIPPEEDNDDKVEVTVPENTTAIELSEDEEPNPSIAPITEKNEKSAPKNEIVKAEKASIKREPVFFVPVERSEDIQEARLRLPILGEEQEIMEAIKENPVVVIAGETGSGKTTQVPQFLYEAGFTKNGKMIGVTEPRRVAAISMSQRVGHELGLPSQKVSYLIRFEGNVTPLTEIKFMTDGVLLKEIQSDFVLSKYSVIIIDEAHERSVYTDILIGLLSRIVPLRTKRGDPLKLIIMSATLRISDFTENRVLFKFPPPVRKVESRQFPVTVHFNKRTNSDYMREAFRKVCRIHTQLPEGGILVFVTGQQEVNLLIKKLKTAFPKKKYNPVNEITTNSEKEDQSGDEDDLTLKGILEKVRKKRKKSDVEVKLPEINLDSYESVPQDDTEADLVDYDSDGAADEENWENETPMVSAEPLWVLPLYSLLPSYKQAKVFEKPPEGFRLCVVATNVAETSLTIPGIKYVVDTGKVKTRLYDKTTGVTSFAVVWESKAGANQRAGRAGRTSPGHCYRLFSSAVFNDEFEDWAVPEIQRRGVDDLMLQMKSLGIDKVANFPFPSSPDREQLKAAESRLTLLGALQHAPGKEKECCGMLTELGSSMAAFPVAPRFAKMLCLSGRDSLMPYTIAAVAALSVQEFLVVDDNQLTRSAWRAWAGRGNSLALGDIMVLLRGICGGEYAAQKGELSKFCTLHGLREKALIEARKIRIQLTNEINLNKPDLNLVVDPLLPPPTDTQANMLRQIFLAGLVDHVARKNMDAHETKGKKRATYRTPEMEQDVYLHSSSALYKKQPEWIIYQEIYETNRMYMRGVTAIESDWLPVFAPTLCTLTPPLEVPPIRFDQETGLLYCHVNGTFGKSAWELPLVEIEFPQGLEKYKWFASFFLDGKVCPPLKRFTKSLLNPPHTMVKSWAKLVSRTESMLKFLASKGVDTRMKLYDVWEEDPQYLLSAYLEWLPESAHAQVKPLWPPK